MVEQKYDSVAQLVEHNTFNVRVLGSSPSGITNKAGLLACFFVLLLILGRVVYPDEQSDIGEPQRDHKNLLFKEGFLIFKLKTSLSQFKKSNNLRIFRLFPYKNLNWLINS
jgi:hypothetical protein